MPVAVVLFMEPPFSDAPRSQADPAGVSMLSLAYAGHNT